MNGIENLLVGLVSEDDCERVLGTLRRMADVRLIDVPEEDAPQLLANVWIVSTYWAVYLSLQEGVEELGQQL